MFLMSFVSVFCYIQILEMVKRIRCYWYLHSEFALMQKMHASNVNCETVTLIQISAPFSGKNSMFLC